MNAQIFYCITHGGYTNQRFAYSDCILVTCPPPELPENWEKFVEPPTSEEMILIDQNATELAMDLELE